jgi:hypothetical protein
MDSSGAWTSDVSLARARLEDMPRGLQLSCEVSVDPSCSLSAMTDELHQRLKASVAHHLGLTVSHVVWSMLRSRR